MTARRTAAVPIARPDATADEAGYAAVLLAGITAVREAQLPTGEIPSYRRGPNGGLEYCRSLFVSTFVHDALGHFDPASPWYGAATLDVLAATYRVRLMRDAAAIRRRIRAFLTWQEDNTGVWRFFGRGAGIDPDADTTACAAAALLEGAGGGRPAPRAAPAATLPEAATRPLRWERHGAALLRFRAAEGLFFSYVHADGTGYTWMDERGGPIVGFDRVVNANVLRYLALIGITAPEVQAYLMREAASGDFEIGSPDYPNPLACCYIVARAWRQACLPDLAELAGHLTPHILARETDHGFGGPLSTAMALSALLDLGYEGPAVARARATLLRLVQPWGGWGHEDFVVHGFGSPPWSTALALVALDRSGGTGGGD